MQTEIAQTIFEKVKILSLDEQKEVLEIVEKKVSVAQKKDSRPIWEVIAEISSQVPDEEWAKLPADGAENHDRYLYGAPKKAK
ncbi:MAG: hypothetical protein ACR2GD_14075 [Pyrinomonadaceae bacterium]